LIVQSPPDSKPPLVMPGGGEGVGEGVGEGELEDGGMEDDEAGVVEEAGMFDEGLALEIGAVDDAGWLDEAGALGAGAIDDDGTVDEDGMLGTGGADDAGSLDETGAMEETLAMLADDTTTGADDALETAELDGCDGTLDAVEEEEEETTMGRPLDETDTEIGVLDAEMADAEALETAGSALYAEDEDGP